MTNGEQVQKVAPDTCLKNSSSRRLRDLDEEIFSHFALFTYSCVLAGILLRIVLSFGPAVCDNPCQGFLKKELTPY